MTYTELSVLARVAGHVLYRGRRCEVVDVDQAVALLVDLALLDHTGSKVLSWVEVPLAECRRIE